MLTGKQLKILNLFNGNLFREYTFKELKKSLKEKSNSILQNAIKQFLKENLITERKIGTSKLYRINHQNDKIYTYLNIITKENLHGLAKKSIEIIKNELNKKTYFYSLVLFGSYANNKQTSKSDLDIAVFIEKDKQKKIIKAVLNSAEDKTLLKLDSHVISKDEFLKMLKAEYANLGKDIATNHLAIYNPNIFYSILKEGIKNGFRI